MYRRNFFQGLAALGLTVYPFGSFLRAEGRPKPLRRVRPGDPAWPGADRWEKLRAAVDGNLLEVTPLFGTCARSATNVSCEEARQGLRNPFYLGDQPGGTQVSGYLNAWQPAASVYAVSAHQPSHVVAAVNFARDNNLRLVVKGGGH